MTLEFTSLASFTKIFTETLNKHAPIKKNILVQTTQIGCKRLTESNNPKIQTSEYFLKRKVFGA